MASVEENRKEPEDILRIQAGFCTYFGKQSHERLLYHSMRKPTLISTFVLTAGGAFALGWLARTNTDTGPEDDAGKLERSAKSSARYRSSRPASSSTTRDSESSGKIEAFLARYSSGGTISPEDMAAAVEGMRRENDPILRRRLFSELLENLSPENAPAAYLALQGGRRGWGPGGGEELRLLTHAWGRLDGAGAVKALTEMQEAREAEGGERRGRRGGRDGEGGGYDLMSVISGWASSDGRSAADYVTSLEDERQQRMLAHGVIRGMMVNGVDEAMSYVASLPRTEDGGRTQSWYMSTIAGEVLEEGLDGRGGRRQAGDGKMNPAVPVPVARCRGGLHVVLLEAGEDKPVDLIGWPASVLHCRGGALDRCFPDPGQPALVFLELEFGLPGTGQQNRDQDGR